MTLQISVKWQSCLLLFLDLGYVAGPVPSVTPAIYAYMMVVLIEFCCRITGVQ